MEFSIDHSTGQGARVGRVRTPHGEFETPAFMPVGTRGSVKALSPDDLKESHVEIVLANTYHLFLRPGHRTVEKLGGLHAFMNWDGPILTDSGGFQVYSLSSLRSISDEGVTFRSHLDGSECFLGPREAMAIQESLGSDIAMCFDECVPYPAEYGYVADSLRLTSRWAEICRDVKPPGQALFGIVQGGMYAELRERSARDLVAIGFDGYALGGLSVGEDRETRNRVIRESIPSLPRKKPVYLMGVGKPEDILDAVRYGVDMFDCVLPTRNARNGTLFTRAGRLAIKNAACAEDDRPVEEGCGCYTCSRFSRAYLRHLFMSKELLAYRLNSIHNVHYYIRFMAEIRQAVRDDRFEDFCSDYLQGQLAEGRVRHTKVQASGGIGSDPGKIH
jgi:queuine tRNA-ribosyltransferase